MVRRPTCPPVCSLCETQAATAKSHIYPAAHFRDVDDGHPQGLVVFTSDSDQRKKRCRTGLYDDSILCPDCERKYNVHDGRLITAIRSEPVAPRRWLDARCTEIAEVDGGELKLAIMHVLWRAHASRREDMSTVELDPRDATLLRALLLANDPGRDSDFPTLVARYTADARFDGMGVYPHRLPFDDEGRYGFVMQMARWVFLVCCNGIPAEIGKWAPFALRRGERPHVFGLGPFEGSAIFNLALDAVSGQLEAEGRRASERGVSQ